MNNIYLFDIDGTISSDGIITKNVINTIKKLRENGNLVMLSTGRCLGQLDDVLSVLEVDGAILNNGGYAYLNGVEFFKSPISKDTINTMINDGLHLAYLSRNSYFKVNDNDPIYDRFTDVFKIKLPEDKDYEYLKNNEIYSLGVYAFNLDFDITKYSDLRFVKVCNLGYDIINRDVTKATPIKYLRHLYKDSKIISFGDNYNDIEMLKESDISVAMGNAPDEVKAISSLVTKSVKEDGVVFAIKELL